VRAALEEQWAGVAAGGLPCGAAVVDARGNVVTSGRNHAYDPAEELATRARYPLQHTRLAHAELNALALLTNEADHGALTLWTTQHPCAMCAAAIAFVGIGAVGYLADDPSEDAPPESVAATRGGVPYRALGDPLWCTVANLLFLYTSAVRSGEAAGNLRLSRDRDPALVALTLDLARRDALGPAARSGMALPAALGPFVAALEHAAAHVPG
jgi:tRNA(Arg) A34 adenosine deaminase TadA